jgi:hypothetical protein
MRASIGRLVFFAVVATMLVFAVTACGSKKSSSSASATDTTATTDTSSSSSDGTTATTDTSTTSTDTSTTSTDTGGGTSSDVSKSCLNFAGAASKLGQAIGANGSTADSADLKKYFEGLASKAPGDIKAAFQTLATAVAKYVDGIKGLNLKPGETPSAADLTKLQSAAASMSTADVRAASTKISAWVKAGCHS